MRVRRADSRGLGMAHQAPPHKLDIWGWLKAPSVSGAELRPTNGCPTFQVLELVVSLDEKLMRSCFIVNVNGRAHPSEVPRTTLDSWGVVPKRGECPRFRGVGITLATVGWVTGT